MKKPPSILSSEFKYRASFATDVRKTFERVRRELARQAGGKKPEPAKPDAAVLPMKKRGAAS